jgi:cytochrome c-type biogenesis protein CcmF
MAAFGTFTLLIALVVATYAGVASLIGARRGNRRLIASGRAGVYALAAVLGLSSVALVYAFVSHDYSIKYVHHYSDASSPLFYQITAYWGGLDGSILWWVFLLSVFSAIAIYSNRNRHRELLPYTVTVLMAIADFFLFVIVFFKNPFDTYLMDIPTVGKGLNPLLQNAYMVTHPPSLYTGFVGMSIPFAFALAALISGQLDDTWIASVRRWTLGAWFFLSMGLTLGMLWAYEELGWGGFWGWDPVENAGFLPWLTATAFLHSIMIQERRGMMKIWNVTLIIVTFFLTIFGTFMTRSGVVQSVHSFGENPELAMMFSIFMAVILIFSFGMVIYRLPLLRASNELDSWASREAAFMLNNWILLFSAFFILFVTMFPTLSEAITGERITIGPPFFNRWMVPIGLILLLLTGIGPLLAWRKTTVSNLKYQFMWPVTGALVSAALVVAFGIRVWSSGICFVLCGFVLGTVWQEFWRGAVIRRQSTGTDLFTATIGLVGRSRRRYGGYIVHVGIVLMFLGFAGQGYKQSELVQMKPGQQATLGDYTVRMDDLRVTEDSQKQMITGHFTLFHNGVELAKMYPARWAFFKHEEPTTEVAIRRRLSEDFYLNMPAFQVKDKSASLEITINPLVNWIWLGFAVMALGTGIVLLPESTFAFAMAKFPAPEVATTAMALWLILGLAAPMFAQSTTQNVLPVPKDPLERRLHSEIVCTCGCRRALDNCGMPNCGGHAAQSEKIRALMAEGKDHDSIIATFIRDFGGQDILIEPNDKGLNRIAWAFPYALAGLGAIGGAFAIRKWSHWSGEEQEPVLAAAGATPAGDAALQARLDRELENLD